MLIHGRKRLVTRFLGKRTCFYHTYDLAKMAGILQMIFSYAFSWLNETFDWQHVNIGLANGLVSKRREAITWTKVGTIWRH